MERLRGTETDGGPWGGESRNLGWATSAGRTRANWLAEAPIAFRAGDSNLFRYVGNNVLNATDPSGLEVKIKSIAVTDKNIKMGDVETGMILGGGRFAYGFHVTIKAAVSKGDTMAKAVAAKKVKIKQEIFSIWTYGAEFEDVSKADGVLVADKDNPVTGPKLISKHFTNNHLKGKTRLKNATTDYKAAVAALKVWKDDQKLPYTEDGGIAKNLFNEEATNFRHGDDWVEYIDAPGYPGTDRSKFLDGDKSLLMGTGSNKYFSLRVAVRITATGTDGKTVTADFWYFRVGEWDSQRKRFFELTDKQKGTKLPKTWP